MPTACCHDCWEPDKHEAGRALSCRWPCMWATLSMLFIASLVGGLIFGNMSLAYRETGFTSISSDGATILEPTTGQTFQVETTMITTRLPESRTADDPGVGWSDTKYLVLYDPQRVMQWTLGSMAAVVMLSGFYLLWEFWRYIRPIKSCKCRGNQCHDCNYCCLCQESRDSWMTLWLLLWGAAALIGGAIVGTRNNKIEEGLCGPRYFHHIQYAPDQFNGGPHLNGHWGVEFYGHSNNFQNTYATTGYGAPPWQTNIWPVDISSPHPKTESACWLDLVSNSGGVTFNNPYWVQIIFWPCMFGVALGCIMIQYWCCKEPCFSCMEPTFEACDAWCNSPCCPVQSIDRGGTTVKFQCKCCGCQCICLDRHPTDSQNQQQTSMAAVPPIASAPCERQVVGGPADVAAEKKIGVKIHVAATGAGAPGAVTPA